MGQTTTENLVHPGKTLTSALRGVAPPLLRTAEPRRPGYESLVRLPLGLELRQLRHSDHRKVFEFQSALYAEGYLLWNANLRHLSDRWVGRNIVASALGQSIVSVAEADGRIAGIATVERARRGRGDTGVLIIAVANGLRRNGVGTSLMLDVLERSRGRFERVDLYVSEIRRPEKHRFYRRFGFRKCGRGEVHWDGRGPRMEAMTLEFGSKGARPAWLVGHP